MLCGKIVFEIERVVHYTNAESRVVSIMHAVEPQDVAKDAQMFARVQLKAKRVSPNQANRRELDLAAHRAVGIHE